MYRMTEVIKERAGQSGRDIHGISKNRGVVWAQAWCNPPFHPSCGLFPLSGRFSGLWSVCYLASDVLQWGYNEVQCLLEVKSSTIVGLAGTNHFLFSSLQLSPVTSIRVIFFHLGEREGCDSGATTSVIYRVTFKTDIHHTAVIRWWLWIYYSLKN